MKIDCSIVKDLLPLYVENMVSADTAKYIEAHLQECDGCRSELALLKGGEELTSAQGEPAPQPDSAKPFKKIMKKMNRKFYSLAYSLIIFFIFLGFGWTGGENLMYNSLIMPIVGVFGYCVFNWKAIYKVPLLLLAIDSFVCLFGFVELDIYSLIMWTAMYSLFVGVGIAIAFLLHYAFRKEKDR